MLEVGIQSLKVVSRKSLLNGCFKKHDTRGLLWIRCERLASSAGPATGIASPTPVQRCMNHLEGFGISPS